jgi:hypothetical protein
MGQQQWEQRWELQGTDSVALQLVVYPACACAGGLRDVRCAVRAACLVQQGLGGALLVREWVVGGR